MDPSAPARIELLYDALNRRSVDEMISVCHPEIEAHLITGRLAERSQPYRGYEGLRTYLEDIGQVWDELLVTPRQMAEHEGGLVVWGRVFARSKTLGIRDLPVVWLWEERDSLLVRGSVVSEAPEGLARPSPS